MLHILTYPLESNADQTSGCECSLGAPIAIHVLSFPRLHLKHLMCETFQKAQPEHQKK